MGEASTEAVRPGQPGLRVSEHARDFRDVSFIGVRHFLH